ncbi:MAG: exopolysaccharide biosynthesis polyprenyl glycosylphosphotransferase [Desulfuromonadaceae bacterium]|nr:exopolysaccharide biosynthesis polyprenyl glycosylphosphotransferase [Desulfuromonadaceae bacterium]
MNSGDLLHALNRSVRQPSRQLWLMAGAWLVLALPVASRATWGTWLFWHFERGWPLVILCATAFLVAAGVVSRLQLLPRSGGWGGAVLCLSVTFLCVIFIVTFWRLYYSRTFLAVIYPLSLVILLVGCRNGGRGAVRRMAVIPGGQGEALMALPGFAWQLLKRPELAEPVDGVAVDLHRELPFKWSLFLSDCALKGIPIYHSAVIFENETGRASLAHFSEGLLGAVHGAALHAALKRVVDVLLIVTTVPLWLPLLICVALAIRLDSAGPVLFWQTRVGQAGQPFQLVKFRSMLASAEQHGSAFAQRQDDRVTAVGKMIRIFRIDELPQFWNVLRGEMSLIGPRPEQTAFVERFKKEIPYYDYRHLVKPGITGWAQVNHGYAADKDATLRKVEFDLYYIKHLSFWLDFLIFIKTMRTVVTGFGAR